MIVEIIFAIIFVLAVLYVAADWAYYSGYDRAWNVVMDEWVKELAKNPTDDDTAFDKWMLGLDAYSEITDALHREADNIQLNKVIEEWLIGHKRSKSNNKRPPVQSDTKYKTTD